MQFIKDNVKHIFIPIKLFEWQKTALAIDNLMTMFLLHRQAGKTVMCCIKLVLSAILCQRPNPRFWFASPEKEQGMDNIWEYLVRFTKDLPNVKALKNRATITFDFGDGKGTRTIAIKGLNINAESKRGAYLDGIVIDEAADVSQRTLEEIIYPMLISRDGWLTMVGTMKPMTDWFYLWEKETNAAESNFEFANYNIYETGIYPEEKIESIRRSMSKERFAQEYENNPYAISDGAYYADIIRHMIEKGHIAKDKYGHNPNLPVITSWDLGSTDPTAIWFFQKSPEGVWHVIDYMEESLNTIREKGTNIKGLPFYLYMLMEVYKKPYKYSYHILPWDAKMQTGNSQYSTWTLFKQQLPDANFTIAPRPINKAAYIPLVQSFLTECRFCQNTTQRGIDALYTYKSHITRDGISSGPKHDAASHGATAMAHMVIKEKDAGRHSVLQKNRKKVERIPYSGFNFTLDK